MSAGRHASALGSVRARAWVLVAPLCLALPAREVGAIDAAVGRRTEATNETGGSQRSLWRGAPAPSASLLMCVVVPVRNEALALACTLASIAAQRTLQGAPFDMALMEVLVLANNCTDDSARIARAFAKANPAVRVHVDEVQLPHAQAHIGHVRRLLMEAACQRLELAGTQGFVVSTDGDTVVEPHWLAAMLQEFEAGADVVGGRILLDSRASLDGVTLRHQRCDAAYRLARSRLEDLLDPDPADPWPRHHQHFCASLALRSQAYRQVGGIPDVRFLEDVALVDACRLADLRVRHSPLVRVRTSPRREGRVEVGLSWQLRQWGERNGAAAPMWVEDPDVLVARVMRRRALREVWRRVGANAIPSTSATFGALWCQAQEASADEPEAPKVLVRQAIDRLRALIAFHSRGMAPRQKNSSPQLEACSAPATQAAK